ncbi:MAG: energy transducer TonB, partial [Candidatus Omnitrophica bacterium]|nr:energy transducer TonB [Candidatus Omnitrophota bacterium]
TTVKKPASVTISKKQSEKLINEPLSPSLELKGAVVYPKPLMHQNEAPIYPRIARIKGWTGKVWLEVYINTFGAVQNVNVVKSSGHHVIDQAALEAVREWKFIPASVDGVPEASKIILPIELKME